MAMIFNLLEAAMGSGAFKVSKTLGRPRSWAGRSLS
jgi:hypothetical protein